MHKYTLKYRTQSNVYVLTSTIIQAKVSGVELDVVGDLSGVDINDNGVISLESNHCENLLKKEDEYGA